MLHTQIHPAWTPGLNSWERFAFSTRVSIPPSKRPAASLPRSAQNWNNSWTKSNVPSAAAADCATTLGPRA